jgi:transcriptional regulator with XRE-family HTH domain
MTLSKRIKELRNRRGLSVKELSIKLQIPESTYRGYEYGSKLPADLVPALCLYLGLNLEDFYKETAPSSSETTAEGALQSLYSIESDLQEIKKYIKLQCQSKKPGTKEKIEALTTNRYKEQKTKET